MRLDAYLGTIDGRTFTADIDLIQFDFNIFEPVLEAIGAEFGRHIKRQVQAVILPREAEVQLLRVNPSNGSGTYRCTMTFKSVNRSVSRVTMPRSACSGAL